MDYKHKSGAQKRKEREKELGLSKKGCRTLFEVGLQVKSKGDNSDEIRAADADHGPVAVEADNDMLHVDVAGPSSKNSSPQQTVDEGFADTAGLEVIPEDSKDISDYDNSGSSHDTIICDLPMQDLGKPDPVASVPVISSDLGQFHNINYISAKDIEFLVKIGPPSFPKELPSDGKRAFPRSVLVSKLANGETVPRDWLSWSESTRSLHCLSLIHI